MISEQPDKVSLSSWGISLAFHTLAVGLALAFAAQLKPVLKEDVFKWDVTLVQSTDLEPASERAEPVIKPPQPQARVAPVAPIEPVPDAIVHRVAPQQTVQMVHPVTEPVKPTQQKLESLPQIEQKPEVPQPKMEPIEQKVVEIPKPKAEPVVEAKASAPVQHAEPLVAPSRPVAVAAAEPVEPQSAHHEPTPQASAAPPAREAANTPATDSVSIASPSPGPSASEAPKQVAKATAPSSEVKADHRWLAESLWQRVAELKRYPSSARLNGQEGKVILKAVIRSDGQLAEVSVQKSSGHSILDMAAMEAVKLACPLQMKHAISRPEIVVSLPIVYSLAN